MPRISTHVLDIERGKPAEGIAVELFRGDRLLGSARTNANGRTDAPLVTAERLEQGEYALIFHVGEYLAQPSFYGDITIRFCLSDGETDYHVPLLLASHGYSTYRGS